MSKKIESSSNKVIRYEDGIIAAKIISETAAKEGQMVAICGGLALHIYGFTRATKDVDVLGNKELNLKATKKLNFGGVVYEIDVNGQKVSVDLIIRNDEAKEFYQLALENAKIEKTIGLRIVSPEYLVIMKYLAGRGKDQIDLLWLLREDKLVNRSKVKAIITKQMGKHSYWALRDMEQLYLEADLLKARDEKSE